MTETETTTAPAVDFLTDGTIRLRLSKTYRLRRPKLKEYRRLREDFYALNDEIGASAEAYRDEGKPVEDRIRELSFSDAGPGDDGEPTLVARPRAELTAEERDELRGLRRRSRELLDGMLDRHGELRFGFFCSVIETLAPEGALVEDDQEAWMTNGDLLVDFFAHWMSVPLGRGPAGKR
jgi:hypothetical protein